MRQTKQEIKSLAVEQAVRSYFLHYPLETFDGLVHTDEVIENVTIQFSVLDLKFTAKDRAEVFGMVYELGPQGENDLDWLHDWGPRKWEEVVLSRLDKITADPFYGRYI